MKNYKFAFLLIIIGLLACDKNNDVSPEVGCLVAEVKRTEGKLTANTNQTISISKFDYNANNYLTTFNRVETTTYPQKKPATDSESYNFIYDGDDYLKTKIFSSRIEYFDGTVGTRLEETTYEYKDGKLTRESNKRNGKIGSYYAYFYNPDGTLLRKTYNELNDNGSIAYIETDTYYYIKGFLSRINYQNSKGNYDDYFENNSKGQITKAIIEKGTVEIRYTYDGEGNVLDADFYSNGQLGSKYSITYGKIKKYDTLLDYFTGSKLKGFPTFFYDALFYSYLSGTKLAVKENNYDVINGVAKPDGYKYIEVKTNKQNYPTQIVNKKVNAKNVIEEGATLEITYKNCN
jgi:hypothetical protein